MFNNSFQNKENVLKKRDKSLKSRIIFELDTTKSILFYPWDWNKRVLNQIDNLIKKLHE